MRNVNQAFVEIKFSASLSLTTDDEHIRNPKQLRTMISVLGTTARQTRTPSALILVTPADTTIGDDLILYAGRRNVTIWQVVPEIHPDGRVQFLQPVQRTFRAGVSVTIASWRTPLLPAAGR